MAEYVLAELTSNDASFKVYADTVSLLPVRVEIQGVSGRYRFFVTNLDRTRSFTTTFNSPTKVSRNIGAAVASRYEQNWQIGIEAV